MARSFSQILFRTSSSSSNPSTNSLFFVPKSQQHLSFRLVTLRHHSSQSENNNTAQIIDPNLVDSEIEQREALAVQRIEDAIHRIIARRSAPDWLPFRPGSSYWVPPRRSSYGIADLVHSLANSLTEEEVMSLTTSRGWPSSAFFSTTVSPDPSEVDTTSTKVSQSEDEEG